MMYKSASRPKRTPIEHTSNHSSAMDPMDRPNHDSIGQRNYGLKKRASFANIGIFLQDRYMLNEVNVKVRLVRNKDSFCLMLGEANASYNDKLIGVVLLVHKMQLSPSVFLAHVKPSSPQVWISQWPKSCESSARLTLSWQATWTAITWNCLLVNSRRGL